jgi:hypothetical protein
MWLQHPQYIALLVEKAGGHLGEVVFNTDPPERNAISHKLIRVMRSFR